MRARGEWCAWIGGIGSGLSVAHIHVEVAQGVTSGIDINTCKERGGNAVLSGCCERRIMRLEIAERNTRRRGLSRSWYETIRIRSTQLYHTKRLDFEVYSLLARTEESPIS
jgi:hypothetical protein